MTEPVVSYPLSAVLGRIEQSVADVRADVHQMQLDMARSSATEIAASAASAIGRANRATLIALGSLAAAAAAVVAALIR